MTASTPLPRHSFDTWDLAHLYELSLEHFITGNQGGCFSCIQLKKRLEKILGESEVRRVKKQVKKYPYCEKK